MTVKKKVVVALLGSVFALVAAGCGDHQDGYCYFICSDGHSGCGTAQADINDDCRGSAEISCDPATPVEWEFSDCECDDDCEPSWY